jgi:hypothetical protein
MPAKPRAMTPALEKLHIVRADRHSLGTLEFECQTDKGPLRVSYRFPDNTDLFSPEGDFHLKITLNETEIPCTPENNYHEAFRMCLPRIDRFTANSAVQAATIILNVLDLT